MDLLHVQLLKGVPFFSGLSEKDIAYFLKHASIREYPKRTMIFDHGDKALHFFIVLEGWIKLFHVNSEGQETVTALVTKGDTFSETATFEHSDYPYSAQVVGGVARCLTIPVQIIREKVRTDPNMALNMLASLSRKTHQLGLTFEHISQLTAAQRLACFLLKLSMDRQYAKAIKLPYNKLLVASRLGMQPETFSRALKRLVADLGIIVTGRQVDIPNIEALQAYCEVVCCTEPECSLQKKLLCMNPHCDIYRMLKIM
ncbi:MAG: Crp/Fnr family transcriptional regulator [Alphaproteobacteria bacterium]